MDSIVLKGLFTNGTTYCVRNSSLKWLWVQVLHKTFEIDLWCKFCEIVKRSKIIGIV